MQAAVTLGLCRARNLTDEQRGSIAAFLSMFKGVENGKAKLASLSVHPSVERAHALCLTRFREVNACCHSSCCGHTPTGYLVSAGAAADQNALKPTAVHSALHVSRSRDSDGRGCLLCKPPLQSTTAVALTA